MVVYTGMTGAERCLAVEPADDRRVDDCLDGRFVCDTGSTAAGCSLGQPDVYRHHQAAVEVPCSCLKRDVTRGYVAT